MNTVFKAIRALFLVSSCISLFFLWMNRDMITGLLGMGAAPGAATPGNVPSSAAAAPDSAAKLAAMISAAAPNNAKAQMAVGALYLRQDKTEEAMAAFKKAVELDPKDAGAHFQIGMILMKHDKIADSEQAFREAVRLDPENTDARFGLAAILQKRGMLDEAIELYKEISQKKPMNAEAHNNLGIIYDMRNQKESAVAEFKTASELDPNDTTIKQNLEDLLREIQALKSQPVSTHSPSSQPAYTPNEPPPAAAPLAPPADSGQSGEAPIDQAAAAHSSEPEFVGSHTVRLVNGRALTGNISEKTDSGIWLEFGSGKMFFSNEEIAEIDG